MNTIEIVFEWLLTATLRASVLAVVILGIQFVLRHRLPAAWRHALWLPMLAVLVLPVLPEAPFALLPPKVEHSVVVDKVMEQIPATSDFSASEIVFTSPGATPSMVEKRNIFPMAWLLGACLVLAAGAIGYVRNMRQIRLSATSPDSKLQAIIEEAANKAGLKRAPQTLISPAVASPAVTGLVRPVLLLPAGFPEGFSAVEARLILLHEFTHLKRFDLPLNWLFCVLQAMHWFNPLLWLAFARMRADREAACDARVLSIDATDRRSEYGGALLKLQCVTPSRFLSLGFVGIFERGSGIKSRIQGISNYRPDRFAWKVAGGAILILLMLFGVTQGQQPDASSNGQEKRVAAPAEATEAGTVQDRIQKQLDSLIIPSINFNNATVEEAIQFLRQRSQALDTSEPDPAKRGVDFVLQIPDAIAGEVPKITLQLQNIPLSAVLRFICDAANLSYTVSNSAVIISPKPAQELLQQKTDSLNIPSNNFNNATVEKGQEAAPSNPVFVESKEIGKTYESLKELDKELSEQGYVRQGNFAKEWPAKVIRVQTATDGITFQFDDNIHSYPGYDGYGFKVVILLSDSGNETAVVYRSKERNPDSAYVAAQKLLQQKIDSIIIPTINFNNATVEEAIQFLRLSAQKLDTSEPDPAKRGVNFVLPKIPDAIAGEVPKITLQLQNIPLSDALQHICNAAHFHYDVQNSAVVMFPILRHFQSEKRREVE